MPENWNVTSSSSRPARTSSNKLGRASRRRLRKVRALLAAGLVFGIGASATLAAWTDTEYSSAEFTAGVFAIEASVDGVWNNTAEMTFNAQSMYPGATVYAPAFIRTSPDSTIGAEIITTGGGISSNTGIAAALEYRAVTTTLTSGSPSTYTCTADMFSAGAQYLFGSSSTWVKLKDATTATSKQTALPAGGNVVAYCFQVRLPTATPNSAQGTSATHTWTWDAQSILPGDTP